MSDWTVEQAEREWCEGWTGDGPATWYERHAEKLIARAKEADALEAQVAALREAFIARGPGTFGHVLANTEAAAREHDARIRADERKVCAKKLAASLREPEFLEWDKRDRAEYEARIRREERARCADAIKSLVRYEIPRMFGGPLVVLNPEMVSAARRIEALGDEK